MHWIAPAEKDAASASLEKRLRDAADQFRANSGLSAQARTLEQTIASNIAGILKS